MFTLAYSEYKSTKLQKRTSQNVGKIKSLLMKALGEVQAVNGRLKNVSSSSWKTIKSEQSSECQQIKQVLFNLRKGYIFNKYSQKNTQPNTKFVYVSEDNRYLCWKSMEKDDQKRMQLITISKIIKQGAQYHIKSNFINNINCCLVIFGQERKLIVEGKDETDVQYFRYELQRAIKYSRNLKLNYKYIEQ